MMCFKYLIVLIILIAIFIFSTFIYTVLVSTKKGKRSLVMLRFSIRDKRLTSNVALGIFAGSLVTFLVSVTIVSYLTTAAAMLISFIAMIHENYKKKLYKQ